MAEYLLPRMKRKDLEQVNDEFSDFSLSSPARKIRRLDAELPLPPIMEEEEAEFPAVFEQSIPEKQRSGSMGRRGASVIEELPAAPVNEEKAIVLFKPINTPLLQSPSNHSFSVSSDIISGLRNQICPSSRSNPVKSFEEEAAKRTDVNDECLAVVPWISSQFPPQPTVPQTQVPDLMEGEEMEASMMDIEDNAAAATQHAHGNGFGDVGVTEGLHHWQQQHCMISQLPQNISTPVVWFR